MSRRARRYLLVLATTAALASALCWFGRRLGWWATLGPPGSPTKMHIAEMNRRFAEDPLDPEAWFMMGVLINMRSRGSSPAATPYIRRSVRLDPDDLWHREYLALHLQACGRAAEAGAEFDRAAKVMLVRGGRVGAARLCCEAAGAYGISRDYESALGSITRAIEYASPYIDPQGDGRMLRCQGICLWALGRYREAEAALTRAIAYMEAAQAARPPHGPDVSGLWDEMAAASELRSTRMALERIRGGFPPQEGELAPLTQRGYALPRASPARGTP